MNRDNYSSSFFPKAPTQTPNYECAEKYTVKAGDTLYTISQLFGIPVAILMQANRILNPYCLKIGQTICIPSIRQEPIPEERLPQESPPQMEIPPVAETPEPPAPPAEVECDGFYHTVVAGDSFYTISKRYNIPLDVIMNANPNMDPQNLQIGSRVCVPSIESAPPEGEVMQPPEAPAPPPVSQPVCDGILHTVVRGDSFYTIARRYKVPLDTLMNANPNMDPQNLQIGSRVCVPIGTSTTPPQTTEPTPSPPMTEPTCDGIYHTVLAGDSFYTIAKKYNIQLETLMNANPNMDPQNLLIGSRVCVPGVTSAEPPEEVVTPPPPPPDSELVCDGIYHTVVAGDSFYKIAKKYQVKLNDIINANKHLDPLNLQIGSKVCVPKATASTPPRMEMPMPRVPDPPKEKVPCQGFYHTVVENDTLYAISNRYNVSLDAILQANPDLDPYNLRIGMKLCIPADKQDICYLQNQGFHFVHIGDNFDILCRKFGILPINLLKANPNLTVIDYSVPGTKIIIPR
jgi:peptidoglycan endopeptidase LytF